jgi:hypothetical protein
VITLKLFLSLQSLDEFGVPKIIKTITIVEKSEGISSFTFLNWKCIILERRLELGQSVPAFPGDSLFIRNKPSFDFLMLLSEPLSGNNCELLS